MSISGLTTSYIPASLDGLNVIDADQIYIDGQLVNLTDYVPYQGANRTIDAGGQNIQTTHTATAPNDVVNKGVLDTTINNLTISIGGSFLDKVTTTPQTVIGNVSYTAQLSADDFLVPAAKKASLGSILTVDANWQRSETDATVSVVQYFGSITSSMGIYQATSTQNFAILQCADLGTGTGKRMRITWNLNINEPSYNSSIQLFASSDGTTLNQYLGPSVSFTPSDPLYKVLSGTFVPQYRFLCIICITTKPGGVQTVRWYGLDIDEQGVELTNVTMPSLGADKVAVFNGNKQLVSSGVSTTTLNYLDVSSSVQTQLNAKASTIYVDSQDALKLNLSGSNANQNIVLGGYKVQSTANPTTNDDLTRKAYVDSVVLSAVTDIPRKADVRTGVAPNAQPGATMSWYFGTHSNNNVTPYSDMMIFNGWVDGSGGYTNMVSLNKGGKGIRQFQGTYGSSSNFSNHYDCVMTDLNSANVTLGGTLAMGANKVTTSYTPVNAEDLTRKGYVDTQDDLRVLKAGDTMTGTLYNSGGDFHAYKGGDVNRSAILFANNADGATYTNYNGGLASWFGIGFKSTLDGITRYVYDTRSGASQQVGKMTAGGINNSGATGNRVAIYDVDKNLVSSSVTDTTLTYLDIGSSLVGLLNAKANLVGGNTFSGNQIFNSGSVSVSSRFLGEPDASPIGNFWMGLRGTASEEDRLAISINGNYSTGLVDRVIIAKALRLAHPTANRVLTVDTNGDVVSSSVTPVTLSYLDATSSVQSQIDTKASTSYVDSGLALKANLVGPQTFSNTHTFNSPVPIVLSSVTPSRVLQLSAAAVVEASNVTTTELSYVSGVSSPIQSQLNTLSGTFANYLPQTGGTLSGNLTVQGASGVTLTDVATTNGFLSTRYYVAARGDNQDNVGGDNAYGPWYGLGASGIPDFTGVPCLAGYAGLALRTSTGVLVLKEDGTVGIGTAVTIGRFTIAHLGGTDFQTLQNTQYADGQHINQRFMFGKNNASNASAYIQARLNADDETDLLFYVDTGSSLNERFRIRGNGTIYANASLGIGTLIPEYQLDVAGSTRVTGTLYVGTENNASSQIAFGGVSGDSGYDHTVIECRKYNQAGEGSELVLFKGNDIRDGSLVPDRVRLRGANICFDTYPNYSTDRTAENIRMTIDQNGVSFFTAGDNSYSRYGPNTTWGGYLHVGATTNKVGQAETAQVICTNGNLHLDAGYGRDVFLNYYPYQTGNNGVIRSYGTMEHTGAHIVSNTITVGTTTASVGKLNIRNSSGEYTHFNYTDGFNYIRGNTIHNNVFRCYSTSYWGDWIRISNNNTGLYWEGLERGIVSPEQQGNSYGNVTTYGGGRNGWAGYGVNSRWCFMANGNECGIHDNTYSWALRTASGVYRQLYLSAIARASPVEWDRFVIWRVSENDWNGGYWYFNQAGGWGYTSDERIKKDIAPLSVQQSISFLKHLQPTTFRMKDTEPCVRTNPDGSETVEEAKGCNCVLQDGFIAQNILEACVVSGVSKSVLNNWYGYEQEMKKPEEERKLDKDTILGVNDRPILSHTVNAVKGLMEEIDILTQRNKILETWAREQEVKQKEQEAKIAKMEANMEKMASLLAQLISSK